MRKPAIVFLFLTLPWIMPFSGNSAHISQVRVSPEPLLRATSAVLDSGTEVRTYMGSVEYVMQATARDSLHVTLSFVASDSSPAPQLFEVQGDVGDILLKANTDSIYRIFFRLRIRGTPAPTYVAQVSADYTVRKSELRIDSLLQTMTRAEKIEQCHGWLETEFGTSDNSRLGIAGFRMADGPHGVRWPLDYTGGGMGKGGPSSLFPTCVAMACTWDTALVESIGVALGREFRAKGVYVALGPMLNLVRDPRGGRSFETFSEDPWLSGRMAVAHIRGMQSVGVIATPKHFACYSRENERTSYNVVVDERPLREVYLPAFRDAVIDGQAWSIMAAYPKVNGSFCTASRHLLQTVLKEDWRFKGFVMSDWAATHSLTVPANAGLDLEMPSGDNFRSMASALEQGWITDATLDDKVRRILRAKQWAGTFDPAYRIESFETYLRGVEHQSLTRSAASRSIVLARNSPVAGTPLLPIDTGRAVTIALIGRFADSAAVGGGGSSLVTPYRLVTARQGILNSGGSRITLLGPAAAAQADYVIVFVGVDDEREGKDRTSLRINAADDQLVSNALAVNPRTIVVYNGGSASQAGAWSSAPAVVIALYPGQEQGSALADILFGKVNPSGKLPVSFPHSQNDLPFFDVVNGLLRFASADTAHGYFYYDKTSTDVLYPFGHGLSYTRFSYTHCAVSPVAISRDDRVDVVVAVTNTGSRSGSEVVQLYVEPREPHLPRRVRELRRFARIELAPGERREVSFTLDARDFSVWDVEDNCWVVDPGTYAIHAGASSRDLRVSGTVHVF